LIKAVKKLKKELAHTVLLDDEIKLKIFFVKVVKNKKKNILTVC